MLSKQISKPSLPLVQRRPARFGASVSMTAVVWVLISSPAMAVDPQVLEAENRRVKVVKKVAPTVVAIFGEDKPGGGSGVIISADGYALSNFHVTNGTGTFMRCGLNDGKVYDAVIVGVDPTGDVALLKLFGRDDFPVAELGDSDAARVGDWVYVMGNPFLLATDFKPTVTYGIISGVHRYQYPAGTFLEYTDCIQVDASINPGNSGGPLFNSEGQLIGINGRGSFEKRGRVNVGAGYSISINQIKNFMGHLRSGRIVDHASLGIIVTTDGDDRIVVDRILESTDAFRCGLRETDEIISFAGRSITSVNQLKNILGIFPKMWQVPIVYRREGKRIETMLRLEALHHESELDPRSANVKPPEGEKKKEEKKEGEKIRKLPIDIQKLIDKAKPNKPHKYAEFYKFQKGFANYYFNELEQNRVLNAQRQSGDFSRLGGKWLISGLTDKGDEFEAILSNEATAIKIGETAFIHRQDAPYLDEPEGTGGFLPALAMLRLILMQDKQAFSEFYYWGTEPLDGRPSRTVDVVHANRDQALVHGYYHPSSGLLVGIDCWLGEDVDPCQIRFAKYSSFGERQFPSHWTVQQRDNRFAVLNVKKVEFRPTSSL